MFKIININIKNSAIILLIALCCNGCASLDQMGQKEKNGTSIGAAGGALIGRLVGDKIGGKYSKTIGTLAGFLVGGVIGNRIGHALDERDKEVKKISESHGVQVDTEVFALNNGKPDDAVYSATVLFKFGSFILTDKERIFVSKIVEIYKKKGIRTVMIVGHTDYMGSTEQNQLLSEKRAYEIAKIFVKHGYRQGDVYYQGMGDSQPIVSNDDYAGRRVNRRVEISDGNTIKDIMIYRKEKIIKKVEKEIAQDKTRRASRVVVEIEKNKDMTDNSYTNNNRAKNSVYNDLASKNSDSKKQKSFTHNSSSFTLIELNGFKYNGRVLMGSGVLSKNNEKWNLGALFGGEANASVKVPDFLSDSYNVSGSLMRMDGQYIKYTPYDCIDGFYKQPVYAYVGKGFISIYPVSILKNNMYSAESYPVMSIYKKYVMGESGKKDMSVRGVPVVYVSGEKILYRWIVDKNDLNKTGLLGVDVLMRKINGRKNGQIESFSSYIYYMSDGDVFYAEVPFKLSVMKKQRFKISV